VPLTVRVRTAGGIPLARVPVSFAGSCCEFSHTVVATGGDGTATTEWTPTTAGAQSARATSLAIADDATLAVTVSPAPYNHFEQVAPFGFTITAGETVSTPFRVRVLDRYNNPVPGVTVNWVARTALVAVSPTTSVTDAGGIASTQWQFNTSAGIQNFGAQIAGLDPSQDFRVTVLPGPLAALRFEQPGRTIALSSPAQVQAQVKAFDAYGNILPPTATVTFSSTGPSVFTVGETGTVGVLKYFYADLLGVAPGSARLRAQTASGIVAELPVTVTP